MSHWNRIGLTATLIGTLVFAASIGIAGAESAAAAGCDGVYVTCTIQGDGAVVELTRRELDRAKNGFDIETGVASKGFFEYKRVYGCQFNTPGDTAALCANAVQTCTTTPQQQGPEIKLFRRELDANGIAISAWEPIGTICPTDVTPSNPTLGLGQILAAFHNTPWSKPTLRIQPEGNVTLVTLPTYFAVTWPTAGFQPGETDTVTLLGQPVRIRPTLDHYSYVFGDGTTFGPTDSAGGAYPGGDITHAYAKAGTYNTHIDITFGGEFSVAGGAWAPIPDTVTVAGPVQTVTVRTAQARLVIK